jgi:hypothetical protein
MCLSLQEVEQAIEQFPPEQQRQLVAELPRLLKLSGEHLAFLRLAEQSFQFWENPDDAIYDTL